MAIGSDDTKNRNKLIYASTVFNGANGWYQARFETIAENDGESVYEIKVNGKLIKQITNVEVTEVFKKTIYNLEDLYLENKDLIEIGSMAVSNGKIPENDSFAWSRGRWIGLTLIPSTGLLDDPGISAFQENKGFLEVEAELYHQKTTNGSPRNWVVRSANTDSQLKEQLVQNHTDSASSKAYIEALPDTRITHDDELISGVNFFPVPGKGGEVSYKINIETPGRYYVWGRAFSTGPEDNGIHVGLDGTWPESGQRMQWCEGKNKWTWSSAQRVPENHCGTPKTIYLDIEEAGDHIISFSMREDGFELDKWILVKDTQYVPE